MSPVAELVSLAAQAGQPGLGLTDHGVMSGVFQLYRECKKANIAPFPGCELYIVMDPDLTDKKAKRFHITVMALNLDGYKALVKLVTLSHQRDHFGMKPRLSFHELIQWGQVHGQDVAVLSGCYFGVLVQALLDDPKRGRRVNTMLAQTFPHYFVEAQQHNTKHDDGSTDHDIIDLLVDVANEQGVPMIATQDAHYSHCGDKKVHDMMKRLVIHGDAGDVTFPGDSYHLASTAWMRTHWRQHDAVWSQMGESYNYLIGENRLKIPALDKYAFHVPFATKDPDARLESLASRSLRWISRKWSAAKQGRYEIRMREELDVIKHHGFADYFLHIYDVINWARNQKIMVNVRGSANGSLVCWLIDITNVDPIKWDLLFERFMSRERKKPPDIDIDIEDDRRDEVVDYIKTQHEVAQIGTYSTLGLKETQDGDERGSVLVTFLSKMRSDLGPGFQARYGSVKTMDDLARLEPDSAAVLRRLAQMRVKSQPGAHAAGFVISGHQFPISDLVPTMLIPSADRQVTQMVMEDIEDAGFVKDDLLGSRTLTIIRRTLERLGRDPQDWLDWIPLDDRPTMKHIREGRTDTGIFQLEGWTNARGCRELGTRRTSDCIVVNALYRPATLNNGMVSTYLNNRRNKSASYLHPVFEKHLKATHGVPVYQEQVMLVLRDLGMSANDWNDILKAVKQSNDKTALAIETFARVRDTFTALCEAAGMDHQTALDAWEFVAGFAEYGFNKAHATSYGLIGYYTAYLKVHHQLEFMASVLECNAGKDKEDAYIGEARRLNIGMKPADVNYSGVLWDIDPTGRFLRRGMLSVKGVGMNAAVAIVNERILNGPYKTLQDMVDRLPGRVMTGGKKYTKEGVMSGRLEVLRESGSLISLGLPKLSVRP